MIDTTLSFLAGELNGFLGTIFPASEPRAVLSGLVNADGSPPPGIENRIVISFANLERETAVAAGGIQNLDIFFLLSSSFRGNYAEALRFLSVSIDFFHSTPVFIPQNSAGFPEGVERLVIEMVNLNIRDVHDLWSGMGCRYLPSAFFRARVITSPSGSS